MRFYLIGMPFSGKTMMGKELAARLNYRFLDMDDAISNSVGYSILEIFEHYGEAYFRNLESEILRDLNETEMVIATGGGMPCFNDNMNYMNNSGFTIYLNTPEEILFERAIRQSESLKRPHWSSLNKREIREKLHEMLRERSEYYQKAQLEFVGNDSKSLFELLKLKSELWK